MVTLSIDDVKVEVPDGTTILEAARTVGIHIPTLCYLKDVHAAGALGNFFLKVWSAPLAQPLPSSGLSPH